MGLLATATTCLAARGWRLAVVRARRGAQAFRGTWLLAAQGRSASCITFSSRLSELGVTGVLETIEWPWRTCCVHQGHYTRRCRRLRILNPSERCHGGRFIRSARSTFLLSAI